MKIAALAIALAFFVTVAAPITVPSFISEASAQAQKAKPKAKAKKVVKKAKGKKAKKAKKAKKSTCGTNMYMKKGKCLDARNKK